MATFKDPTIKTVEDLHRDDLSWQGRWASWNTSAMMVARAILVAFSLAFIVGGTGWLILGWFISYAILFGVNFVLTMGISLNSLMYELRPQIFGAKVISWNPLRKFYALTFVSFIDFATNVIIWSIWLNSNDVYVTHPQTGTPVINSSAYFSFQAMCGAFIFSTCIYLIFAFNFLRSIWSQKQSYIVHSNDKIVESQKVSASQYAYAQVNQNRKLVSIELTQGSSGLDPRKRDPFIITYLVTGLVFLLSAYLFLFIFFYHMFYATSSMMFTVQVVFFFIGVGSYLVMLALYYAGGERSIKSKILNAPTSARTNTPETNWELDNEMILFHVYGALFIFFNLVFFIDAFSLGGVNEVDWSTVPKYNTAILVQSPYFYVWVVQAALNTGALCFMIYYTVNFFFTWMWNANMTKEEEEEDVKESRDGQQMLPAHRGGAAILIGVIIGMLAVWAVYYGIILGAMMGFHWMATYIYPITVSFAVFFFVGVFGSFWLAWSRMTEVDEEGSAMGRVRQLFNINKDWYLATYRTMIAIPVTYIVQVIILSFTIDSFFHAQVKNDASCINPPSGAPPYNPCSAYWSVAILAMYCTMLVYMVMIINALSNLTTRHMITADAYRKMFTKTT